MIYTVALVGLISMFFAAIPRKQFKYGLEVAWIIICGFLAIRYDFGNDYMGYLAGFEDVNSYPTFKIDTDDHYEPGWQLLCHLFAPFGFYAMVAVLTIFECYIMYRFVKRYVPERYYWFAIFIFVFTPSIMLVGASMMRNMLAITLVIWSVTYIQKRKIIPFVILIFLASQFHSSAVILYPLFLLGFIKNINTNKWVYGLIIVAYVVLAALSAQLAPMINEVALLAGEEEALEYYIEGAVLHEGGSGIGMLLQMFLFVYLVLSMHKQGNTQRLLFLLLTIGTFVRPFASVVPMINRYSYYFDIFAVVCYPIIWGGSKEQNILGRKPSSLFSTSRLWDLCAIGVVVLLTVYGYIQFFNNPVWVEKYSEYHTIFSL